MTRPAAIVTGAASGIGRQLVAHLVANGYDITILDLNAQALEQTAAEARKQGASAEFAVVDVTDDRAQEKAFQDHMKRFGRLDLAVLNAGIAEWRSFYTLTDKAWKKVLDIDLTAVISGVQTAAKCITDSKIPGSIVSVASAAGIFPVPNSPVYAAAKGGLVHFTRSIAHLSERGVKAYAVCPEFVDTPLVRKMIEDAPDKAAQTIDMSRPLLTTQQVVEVVMKLALGQHPPGTCLLLMQGGKLVNPFERKKPGAARDTFASAKGTNDAIAKLAPSPQTRAALAAWAQPQPLTRSYRKMEVHTLTSDFKAATRIVSAQLPDSIPEGRVLIRRLFAGINASDINYTAGRYHNSRREAEAALPFPAGFEGVGIIAGVGPGVKGVKAGDAVASMQYGEFSEYSVLPAKAVLPVPVASAEVLALLVSGLTASIALEVAGHMGSGQTVLVTAAAGGTGQIAVQLAKLAGNRVIATCGGPEKAALLKQLGADRCVDYKSENLKEVLKKEYPKGVDLVYEGVGGDWFNVALDALAPGGRLVIIGMMSQYKEGWPAQQYPGLAEKLLWKSASVTGFFLLRHTNLFRTHLAKLLALLGSGQLRVEVDPRHFAGLDAVAEAVEHLQSGASRGKVVVQIGADAPLTSSRL